MGRILDLEGFHIGETVQCAVFAKERDKTVLVSASTATMTMRISRTAFTTSIYVFNTTPEIVLADEPTAEFTIVLPAATIPLLTEEIKYHYDIYTTSAAGDILHQVGGVLQLQGSVES